MSTSTTTANPLFETVDSWSVEEVRNFLKSKQNKFSLTDDEIEKFKNNNVNGSVFLLLTEQRLLNFISFGPAINIAEFVSQLNSQSKFCYIL